MSLFDKRKKASVIVKELKKLFPKVKSALNYSNNFEMLTAVILSAQCTDKRVNKVTENLFKKYKTIDDFTKAEIKTFEGDIKSTGFYRNKAKNIINCAKIILKNYKGKIPDTMEELLKLSKHLIFIFCNITVEKFVIFL